MNDAPFAPTVVLVHGAFADAGSFAEVTRTLIGAGISVLLIMVSRPADVARVIMRALNTIGGS